MRLALVYDSDCRPVAVNQTYTWHAAYGLHIWREARLNKRIHYRPSAREVGTGEDFGFCTAQTIPDLLTYAYRYLVTIMEPAAHELGPDICRPCLSRPWRGRAIFAIEIR